MALTVDDFFVRYEKQIEYGSPSGCWLWSGWNDGRGYGRVWLGGKMRKAHRTAYEAANGVKITDGLVVRHKCDTPSCVNPSHLLIGTHADNVRDRQERKRGVPPPWKSGESCWNAKLTEEDVKVIRDTCVRRHRVFGTKALAKRFGVSQSLVSLIVSRKAWRSL